MSNMSLKEMILNEIIEIGQMDSLLKSLKKKNI